MIITVLLTLIFTSARCQYVPDIDMKPDVTFGDQNDRFDITSIIEDQNKFFGVGPQDYRRQSQHEDAGEKLIEALKDMVNTMRRSDSDFAYHDGMISGEGGDIANFDRNLEKFEKEEHRKKLENVVFSLQEGQDSTMRRKTVEPESEVLLHYAVPIEMRIRGYLQIPLDD